jgi:hypothetical protein
MVYNIQNYWVFAPFPSSGILENTKHDVSETGSISETSCFIFSRMPGVGKVQNPSNSESFLYITVKNLIKNRIIFRSTIRGLFDSGSS